MLLNSQDVERRLSLPMKIPPELFSHILGFVPHSSQSACSLVCSSWTEPAQRWLFHKVVYTRGSQGGEPDVPSLLCFLQESPLIARHVRILDLCGSRRQYIHYLYCRITPEIFAGLLDALPNLEHVELNEVTVLQSSLWHARIEGANDVPTRPGKRLKSLKFHGTRIEGVDCYSTLLQYLRPISSLQTLIIMDHPHITPQHNPGHTIEDRCKSLDLPTHLGVENLIWENESSLIPFFLELVRRSSPRSLRHLHHLYQATAHDTDLSNTFQYFLNDIGDELQSLSLTLAGSPRTSFLCLSASPYPF